MRVLHVVTLIDPKSTFGGPLRVAVNQTKELRRRGIDAQLAAGCQGFATRPTDVKCVPLHARTATTIVPFSGFAGLASPSLMSWLIRHGGTFDVAQIHLSRDLVTLPAAAILARQGVPIILQTHGMIDPSERRLAKPLDAALTRPILRRASTIFYLTQLEHDQLLRVARSELPLKQLVNGVPIGELHRGRSETVPRVVFLARLHERKRPLAFLRAASRILRSGVDAEFFVAGPDEGEAGPVQEFIHAQGFERLRYLGPLDHDSSLRLLAGADVYVLPSVNEPYPMTVLEALSFATPVIITDTCGLAHTVQRNQCGYVVGDSDVDLESRIKHLIRNEPLRQRMGLAGRRLVESSNSMQSVADKLLETYVTTIDSS
jgi:glycosyltransferase involved in cell wall biosynthesis